MTVMGLQVDIADKEIQYLNSPAQQELKKNIDKYVDQLLEEASRLEAVQRTTDGEPQITSSMVNDAAHLISRGYRKQRKPGWLTACQVVAMLSTLFTGLLFDFDRLKAPSILIGFVLLLAAAIIFNVVVLMRDRI